MCLNNRQSFKAAGAIVLSGLFMLGCGSAEPGPALVPVIGKVLKDGIPVADALVRFAPEAAAATSTAMTGPDGTFSLVYRDGTSGAAIGPHLVTVTVGGPTREQQVSLDASAEGDRSVTLPTKIAPLMTHNQSLIVNEGENEVIINFQATGQAGRRRY